MNKIPHAVPTVSRRAFFRTGMAGVSAFYLEPMLRPVNVYATEKAKLRGAAEYCIFIFLNGGASQLDTFDLKEGRWTPPDFKVTTVKPGIVLPVGLFPNLLISTTDPREMARLLSAGLIYIRLEHYVMGAQPSPHAKVMEAVDHFLEFFLSLLGVKNVESAGAKPDGTSARQRKAKRETRG